MTRRMEAVDGSGAGWPTLFCDGETDGVACAARFAALPGRSAFNLLKADSFAAGWRVHETTRGTVDACPACTIRFTAAAAKERRRI